MILFIVTIIFASVLCEESTEEKYINSLSADDKKEFLDRIARRILAEVRPLTHKFPNGTDKVELTDADILLHSAFVEKILKEEKENFRRRKFSQQALENDSHGTTEKGNDTNKTETIKEEDDKNNKRELTKDDEKSNPTKLSNDKDDDGIVDYSDETENTNLTTASSELTHNNKTINATFRGLSKDVSDSTTSAPKPLKYDKNELPLAEDSLNETNKINLSSTNINNLLETTDKPDKLTKDKGIKNVSIKHVSNGKFTTLRNEKLDNQVEVTTIVGEYNPRAHINNNKSDDTTTVTDTGSTTTKEVKNRPEENITTEALSVKIINKTLSDHHTIREGTHIEEDNGSFTKVHKETKSKERHKSIGKNKNKPIVKNYETVTLQTQQPESPDGYYYKNISWRQEIDTKNKNNTDPILLSTSDSTKKPKKRHKTKTTTTVFEKENTTEQHISSTKNIDSKITHKKRQKTDNKEKSEERHKSIDRDKNKSVTKGDETVTLHAQNPESQDGHFFKNISWRLELDTKHENTTDPILFSTSDSTKKPKKIQKTATETTSSIFEVETTTEHKIPTTEKVDPKITFKTRQKTDNKITSTANEVEPTTEHEISSTKKSIPKIRYKKGKNTHNKTTTTSIKVETITEYKSASTEDINTNNSLKNEGDSSPVEITSPPTDAKLNTVERVTKKRVSEVHKVGEKNLKKDISLQATVKKTFLERYPPNFGLLPVGDSNVESQFTDSKTFINYNDEKPRMRPKVLKIELHKKPSLKRLVKLRIPKMHLNNFLRTKSTKAKRLKVNDLLPKLSEDKLNEIHRKTNGKVPSASDTFHPFPKKILRYSRNATRDSVSHENSDGSRSNSDFSSEPENNKVELVIPDSNDAENPFNYLHTHPLKDHLSGVKNILHMYRLRNSLHYIPSNKIPESTEWTKKKIPFRTTDIESKNDNNNTHGKRNTIKDARKKIRLDLEDISQNATYDRKRKKYTTHIPAKSDESIVETDIYNMHKGNIKGKMYNSNKNQQETNKICCKKITSLEVGLQKLLKNVHYHVENETSTTATSPFHIFDYSGAEEGGRRIDIENYSQEKEDSSIERLLYYDDTEQKQNGEAKNYHELVLSNSGSIENHSQKTWGNSEGVENYDETGRGAEKVIVYYGETGKGRRPENYDQSSVEINEKKNYYEQRGGNQDGVQTYNNKGGNKQRYPFGNEKGSSGDKKGRITIDINFRGKPDPSILSKKIKIRRPKPSKGISSPSLKDKKYPEIDKDLQAYFTVLENFVKNNDKVLKQYDWLGSTVDIQAALRNIIDLIETFKSGNTERNKIQPSDLDLIYYSVTLFKAAKSNQLGNIKKHYSAKILEPAKILRAGNDYLQTSASKLISQLINGAHEKQPPLIKLSSPQKIRNLNNQKSSVERLLDTKFNTYIIKLFNNYPENKKIEKTMQLKPLKKTKILLSPNKDKDYNKKQLTNLRPFAGSVFDLLIKQDNEIKLRPIAIKTKPTFNINYKASLNKIPVIDFYDINEEKRLKNPIRIIKKHDSESSTVEEANTNKNTPQKTRIFPNNLLDKETVFRMLTNQQSRPPMPRDSMELILPKLKQKKQFKSVTTSPLVPVEQLLKPTFEDYAEELRKFLYQIRDAVDDLHDAIKHIAMVSKSNTNIYKNLYEVYLSDLSKRHVLEVLIHLAMARLVELVGGSMQEIIKTDYETYITNHSKEIDDTVKELRFIIKLVKTYNDLIKQ